MIVGFCFVLCFPVKYWRLNQVCASKISHCIANWRSRIPLLCFHWNNELNPESFFATEAVTLFPASAFDFYITALDIASPLSVKCKAFIRDEDLWHCSYLPFILQLYIDYQKSEITITFRRKTSFLLTIFRFLAFLMQFFALLIPPLITK